MVAKSDFTVKVTRKEVVAALLPLQHRWLSLSNLDLLLPPLDVSVFFCYKKPDAALTFDSATGELKKALAQALVSYYAFAGEVVPNSVGEPELLCNNRGVDFVQAYADVELQNLNLYNPEETVEHKLAPQRKNSVLSIQVTELKCGGLVLACTFDHRIADAYSANMFLVSWAEMVRSKSLSLLPSFRRSLLNPRRPLRVDPAFDQMYVPVSTMPPLSKALPSNGDQLINRIYYVSAERINELQELASSDGPKRTKLESFSAFLWKTVARYAAKENAKAVMMGLVVDGRKRLSDEGNDMANYFGNVLSIPFGGQHVKELVKNPLCRVAKQVHEFLQTAVTKEHFLGLINWVEAHRPEPAMAKIFCTSSEEGQAVVVSSGQRFPVKKVDFGWGRPVFGSYHFPWRGSGVGYVMPMPSASRDGDWVVYMHLMKGQLELIEIEAADLFRPITSEYLDLFVSK